MNDRELTDEEWSNEIKEALVAFRKARWQERRTRERRDGGPRLDPWTV